MIRFWALISLALMSGCVGVRRELTVESDPPGALVYLNGEEVGRTPVTKEFLYYGTVDLKLRKDGYELLEDKPNVWAPIWQIPPIDLIAEAFSGTDRHKLSYELTAKEQGADPKQLVERGAELRGQLESSEVKK
jgi:hypothetical protein